MKNLEIKEWDMNMIISIFLGIMGLVAIGGWIAISIVSGTSSGTEVPLSIASGLSGVLTGKGLAEKMMKREKEPDFHSPDYGNLSDEQKKEVDRMVNRMLGYEEKN